MHKTAKVGKSSLAQVCPKVLRQVLGEPWSKGVYTRLFYHRSLSQHLICHTSTAMAATHSRCVVWAAVYLPFQTSQWGSLSCFLKKITKSQELCSWERPRAQAVAKGSCCCPSQLICICSISARKKGMDCLNCFGENCRELSVDMALLFAFPAVVVCTGTLRTSAGVAFWFLEQCCAMCVFCFCGEVRVATWRPGKLKAFIFYLLNPDCRVVKGKYRQHLEKILDVIFQDFVLMCRVLPAEFSPGGAALWGVSRTTPHCWNCSGCCWMFPEPDKEPLSRVRKIN